MNVKRIIPCLDVNNGRVVKGVKFIDLIDAGDPVEAAKVYDKSGADELVFLDITATHEGRKTVIDMVSKVAEAISIPFTVGGGIKTIEDFEAVLAAGANKVSLGSAAVRNPELITQAAEKFGIESVVVAVDVKRKDDNSGYNVVIDGGRTVTDIDAVEWAVEVEKRGAGTILPTSMDCDGMKTGYDIEITSLISESVGIPVIASGGAGNMEHFYDALTVGGASAALAASLFHFKEVDIIELKEYLRGRGVNVRL